MAFNVNLSGTLSKTVCSNTQIGYVLEKIVSCTKETIMTYVVPSTADVDNYVTVNLEPFILQAGTSKIMYIETDKRITIKANVGACTGTSDVPSGDVVDFHGINVDTYALVNGDIKNLFINRTTGDVDDATVKVVLWG